MNILIVCTGNTCRSPIAEAILKKELKDTGKSNNKYTIISAGISTINGMNASDNAIEVLREKGIDLLGHKSRVITLDLINEADVILTMTKSHKDILMKLVPEYRKKIYTLREFAGLENLDISDPFGGSLDVYRNTLIEISDAASKVIEKLNSLS